MHYVEHNLSTSKVITAKVRKKSRKKNIIGTAKLVHHAYALLCHVFALVRPVFVLVRHGILYERGLAHSFHKKGVLVRFVRLVRLIHSL